ncbi:MAG: SRPBCC domain-containing protein [Chloroflexi bacterium]|nr:SRPBCC domain-containing protein [Chloroflexota bacterium]
MTEIETPIQLQVRRTFRAPREKVFRAWTDPAMLHKWWRASPEWSSPVAEVDLRVGGQYRLGMQAPDADEPYVVVGEYKEIIPAEKLVYTWGWEHGGALTQVTVEFLDHADGTEIVLTHENFASEAMRDEHAEGWNGCIEVLDKVLPALDE